LFNCKFGNLVLCACNSIHFNQQNVVELHLFRNMCLCALVTVVCIWACVCCMIRCAQNEKWILLFPKLEYTCSVILEQMYITCRYKLSVLVRMCRLCCQVDERMVL
jgi:hypothetical protein